MQNNNWIIRLIQKYLSGAASPEEKEFLDQYYQSFENETDIVPLYTDKQQQDIETRMSKNIDAHIHPNKISSTRFFVRIAKYAASFLLLCTVTFWWFSSSTTSGETETEINVVDMVEVVTQDIAETIYLPDGSIVELSKASKLVYPVNFTDSIRGVVLEGEGYFDIKHNPEQPFIVKSGDLSTRVLGTAFRIRCVEAEAEIQVAVHRGKVSVAESDKDLGELLPNQQISFNKVTKEHRQSEMSQSQSIAQRQPAEYKLDHLKMKEVIAFVEKRWDYPIELEDNKINNCLISATFSEKDSMEEFLLVLCTVLKANYTIENNKIKIYGKGCTE